VQVFHRQGDSSVRLCNFSKICFVGIGCPVAQSCAQNAQSCAMFIFVFISIGCYLSGKLKAWSVLNVSDIRICQ
jgi:hypothetical protein